MNQLKDEVRILKRKRSDLETENMTLNKKIKLTQRKESSKVLLIVDLILYNCNCPFVL